jgi:hypothetical protein
MLDVFLLQGGPKLRGRRGKWGLDYREDNEMRIDISFSRKETQDLYWYSVTMAS